MSRLRSISLAAPQAAQAAPTASWRLAARLPAGWIGLDATLRSGQSFCWRRDAVGVWEGWIGAVPCRIVPGAKGPAVHLLGTLPEAVVLRYFGLDLDFDAILASFPQGDPWIVRATDFAPGLRLLRQEPWETLASFICSAVKQIPQIEQINRTLRERFGAEIAPGLRAFPGPEILARAGEAALRACKLGFRARNLFETARQIAGGEVDLPSLETSRGLSTEQAREELVRLRGVGPKIADCVLLFAYGRLDAFPVDVWVERVVRGLYFPRKRRLLPRRLQDFAFRHFGPNRGYAQQYLFHWVRTARPPEAMKKKTPKNHPKAVKIGIAIPRAAR